MSIEVADLVARLTMDATGFVGGVNGAVNSSKSMGEKIIASSKSIGLSMTAVGGTIEHFGAQMEQAHIMVETAITNSGHNFDDFAGRIAATDSKMEEFGHSQSDTENAVAKLTTKLNDPKAALDAMGVAAELAAYKHTSLSSAADTLGRVMQGNTRVLKQFGIVMVDIKGATTDADNAAKAYEASQTKLGTATQNLKDLQDRLAASTAGAVASAQATQASQQQKVNDLLAAGTINTSALASAQNAYKSATAGVVSAQQTVQDATQKVADAQQKLTNALSDETKLRAQRSAANSLTDANLSLRQAQFDATDAQDKLSTMQASGTATAADLAKQQLAVDSANQHLIESQQNVSDAQDKANTAAKVGTDQDPAVIAAKQGVTDAHKALADAQGKATDATIAQTQAQKDLTTAQQPDPALVKSLADAQAVLAEDIKKTSAASKLSVSDQQALRKAQTDVANATRDNNKAASDNIDAQDKLLTATEKNKSALDMLGAKLKGLAEKESKTFEGRMDALKVKVEDFAGALGEKVGPALVIAGPALAGLGPALKIASGGFNIMKDAATGAFDFIMANPIVLLIAAVVLLAVVIVKNWGTIKKVTEEVFGAVWGFIKDCWDKVKGAFDSVIGWIKDNWPLILGVLTGPFGLMVGEIIKHWGEVTGFIAGIPGAIASIASTMWDGIKNAASGAYTWVTGKFQAVINWIGGIPGAIAGTASHIWDGIRDAATGTYNWVTGTFQNLINWIGGIPRTLANTAGHMFDFLINAFKGAWDWIANTWNTLGFTLPEISLGPVHFGGYHIDLPSLPVFDQGGIVSRPTLGALAMNNKPEAIVPLDRLNSIGGGGGTTNITLMIDGQVIANVVHDNLLSKQRRTGNLGFEAA